MSIFGIIGISFFCTALLCIIFTIVPLVDDGFNGDEEKENKHLLFSLFFCIAIFVAGIFLGIGITTEEERVYVQKYLAQKQTIEMSLENEELSGFERIELVKQATELNGELAERKARFQLWHFVVYDNTIYDNVELIKLTKGE